MRCLPLLLLLGLPILVCSDNTTDPDFGNDVQNNPAIHHARNQTEINVPRNRNDSTSSNATQPQVNDPDELQKQNTEIGLIALQERYELPEENPTNINSSSKFEETKVPIEKSDLIPANSAETGQSQSKSAYVLLIGLSGAGKSSTLNFLFGNREIAKIGIADSTSSNPSILEYVFKTNGSDTDSELHIIDTPGLGSPNGVDHDQRAVNALRNFLSSHPKLSDSIPNVVLLFSNFDDNRMQGNNSRFVSMLKGYELLKDQFTVSKDSNIIFVFTRLLSETRSLAKKPLSKLETFQNIIKKYTSFPEPITLVVADNAIAEEDDPRTDDFGNYRLPNKEFYPKNLIDKMVETCQVRNDDACVSVLQSVFAQRMTIEFTLADQQQSSPSKSVEANNDLYGKQFDIEVTPVSAALAEAYEKIDPELRNTNRGSLEVLQVGFQRKGIKNLEDVPRNADQIISLLQGMNMDLAMVATFERAFRLVVPQYPFDMLTGYGYDVVEDAQLKNSPFLFEKYKFSQAGYMIPDTMTLTLQDEDYSILNFYDNFNDMIESRSRHLGLQDKVEVDSSERNIRPGENVINRWKRSSQEISVIAVHETRTFQLMLNENAAFKPEFRARIEIMPEFDLSDRISVTEWKSLFDEYGAYVVVSAYGGGAIETTVTVKDEELGKLRNKTFNSIRDIVESLPQYTRATKEFKNTWNSVDFQFTYKGGDLQYIEGNMAELDLPKSKESLEKWRESLKTEPIMLESFIQLLPLSEFVKQINSTIASEMESARVALLEGRLIFVEPEEEDFVQTTTEDYSIPNFKPEPGEIEYMQRLNDLEIALQKSRLEQERVQEEILNRMRNNTRAAEAITVAPAPTRPPTTPRPRPRPQPVTTLRPCTWSRNWNCARTTQSPPIARTTTTPKPDLYNPPEDLLPVSLSKCTRKDGCFKQTGFSYDITKDIALQSTPFQPYADNFCKYLPYEQPHPYVPHYVYQNFETVQKYIDFRQEVLGSGYFLTRSDYKGGIFNGHHIFHPDSVMSISIEYRIYENMIKSGCNYYNADFVDDVRALPYYRNTSCASMVQWRSFIEKYGMHYVNSSYVGGYINIRPHGNLKEKILRYSLDTQEKLHNFFDNLNWQEEDFEFEVVGGESTILKTRNDFRKENFARWRTSILVSGGVSLRNYLTVTSLKPLIGYLKRSLRKSFETASFDYISGHLKHCNGDQFKQPCSAFNTGKACYPLANSYCSWFQPNHFHYCVLNAACVRASPYYNGYGICKCLEGSVETRDGSCNLDVY